MTEPIVLCIMPTMDSRAELRWASEACFHLQSYQAREIFESTGPTGVTIGFMRNRIIREAKNFGHADIICHWDDDDWYAPERIAEQVAILQQPGVMVTGYHTAPLYDMRDGRAHMYHSKDPQYLIGASMAYRREWWEAHPFEDKMIGEDWSFWMEAKAAGVVRATDGSTRMVARAHAGMTSPKTFTAGEYTEMPPWLLPEEFVKLEGIAVRV